MKVDELLLLHDKYHTFLHFFDAVPHFYVWIKLLNFLNATFLSVFPQLRLLAIAVHFWQSSAETVTYKAEIPIDLKFSSYWFLQIPSSFLTFHTLGVVVLQYHSSIRILNTQKTTQSTNSSDLILWHCWSTYSIGLVLCSLSSCTYFTDPLELLWTFSSLQPFFCQQKSVTQRKLIQKGRKSWGSESGSLPSSSAGSK